MNESTDPSGADASKTLVKSSGCVQQNGSACQQYSLPMAQAFIELANVHLQHQSTPNGGMDFLSQFRFGMGSRNAWEETLEHRGTLRMP